jgi:16S rRNA (cytidine1402-2'-O)-methyltransferase
VTLVVSGAGAVPVAAAPQEPLEDELRRRLVAGEPPSAVAREVARARGLRRADVYATLERLKKG